jgi:hypothetical protein
MPFLRLTRGSKQRGIQTFARVQRLMPEIRESEIEYLNMRDWYVQELAVLAQFEERLEQAQNEGLTHEIGAIRNKIHGVQSRLIDMKERVRLAGERSFAEAYYLCADAMLNKEARVAIEMAAEEILGRPRHELARAS